MLKEEFESISQMMHIAFQKTTIGILTKCPPYVVGTIHRFVHFHNREPLCF